MRAFIKIGAVVAVAAMLVIIAAAIFAKAVITPERVRDAVLPVAAQALNRDLQLGDISISLFSGIILHDLHVMKRNSDETFLSASRASLRYRLLPLLSLRIVIDEIQLEEPQISIARLPNGTFNFSDLIAETKVSDSGHNISEIKPSPSAESRILPINLTIATVSFDRGTILFTDAAVNPATPAQYRISQINGTARSITLGDRFPFEFSCRLDEASLSIEGHADLLKQEIHTLIKLQNFDAAAYLPYAADQIPGSLTGVNAGLSARIEGNPEQIRADGTLTLNDINLKLDALPDAPIQAANLRFDFDLSADLQKSLLTVHSSQINYNGISADVSGRIDQLNTHPDLSLDLKLADLDIPTALAALPVGLVGTIPEMKPSGTLDIQARLEGPFDRGAALLTNAKAALHMVRITTGGIQPELSGSLQLTEDRLTSQDLFIKTDGGLIHIDLSAQNIFDTPVTLTSNISAEQLTLDTLLKNSALEAGTNTADQKVSDKGSESDKPTQEIGPFDVPVHADGSVKIDRLIYKGLPITTFNLTYLLADNILTIKEMSGQTAEGSFSQTGRVDLGRKGIPYKGTLTLQSLQLDPVVSAFVPRAAKTLFGNLNATLKVDGRGTMPESFKQNLTSNMKINLNDGRINASTLSKGLADFLNIDELRELTFSSLSGTVDIKQGQAQLDTKLDGTDIRISQKGTVGLNGILDLNLITSLGPELLKKLDKRGNVTAYLTNKDGWGQLPLLLKGSLAQPRFSLHSGELLRQTEETVLETLQDKLLEKIQKKQQDSDNQTEEQKKAKKKRKKERKKARKERKAAKKRALENTRSEDLGN